MKVIKDIPYCESTHPLQALDLYLPDGENFPTFVYFHGGGLEKGDKAKAARVGVFLAERGIAYATANYRMYPDAHYPDFILDAASAVAWVKEHIAEHGGGQRIYVGGSSAGGYLSMMLCFDPSYLARHGLAPCDLAGFLHDAGQPTNHFRVLKERGLDPRRVIIDESAPLYHVGTADRYPPMRFIVSDDDMKNRYEQTLLMLGTLRHFGIDGRAADMRLMHGRHCAYVRASEQGEDCPFGAIVCDFVSKLENGSLN